MKVDEPEIPEGAKVPMNLLRQREGDQPLPVANDAPYVQDQLIAFIEQRKQLGIRRYGNALQPHNGRDSLRDAFEEIADFMIYFAQYVIEQDGKLPDGDNG